MSKKILLICYSFPPHPGIGGRRWAKFAKHLSLQNYKIEVFNAQNITDKTSLWNNDVAANSNIVINSHKFQFQNILYSPKFSMQKIIRKVLIKLLKLTKYTPDIITSLPNPKFWKEIETTIKIDQVDQVIVSGDPYLFYYAAKLKQKINFNLIIDYRDLWNDHSFYHSYVKLSKPQKLFFEYAENFAINNCSKIICVDDHLNKIIKKRLVNDTTPIYTIFNGFDKDDFKNISPGLLNHKDKLTLFFAGNISSDLNNQLYHFIVSFNELKNNLPHIYQKMQINIIGNIDDYLVRKINDLKIENLHVETSITDEYYDKLNKADAGIILLSPEYINSFTTKFSDYLYLNKYVISIGETGDFSNFLINNKLGKNFSSSDNYLFFKSLVDEIKMFNPSKHEVKNQFDIEVLTKKLQHVIG